MTVVVVAAVLVVLIVCVTLVTRWALKFAAEGAVGVPVEPLEVEEELDPAVLSVKHLDGWDEIVFDGQRYRLCLKYGSVGYCYESLGWLHYPEGTPLRSDECLKVRAEYKRRLADDESSPTAIAARRAWGKVSHHSDEEEVNTEMPNPLRRVDEFLQREEELDRRVEEALEATRKVDKL